jgi:uncharacterized protein (DUF433 family)
MGHMKTKDPTTQRSFRLSCRTLDLLDRKAQDSGGSRNALADRLLGEALRSDAHPLVRFHTGATGRRQPLLIGTRLHIYQIIASLRAMGGDVNETATYFGLRPRLIKAALAYYADFADEVDEDAACADRLECEERARFERERQALQ